MTEQWRPVPGLGERYEASNRGGVKCVKGSKSGRRVFIVSAYKGAGGYFFVKVVCDGKSKTKGVHQLVALAFLGTCPDGKEVNHIDGDKGNNSPDNLEYLTRSENQLHAVKIGIKNYLRGEQCPNAKLTENKVREIRKLIKTGMKQGEIASRYGVSAVTICNINTGITWEHVK